jgi:XTP/dITP diphosphohydrolase
MEISIVTANHLKRMELKNHLKFLDGIEFQGFLSALSIETLSPDKTAEIHALNAAKASSQYTISDQSGLYIPSLHPSEPISDSPAEILKRLYGMTGFKRAAYLQCSLCFASPTRIIKTVTARCEGLILESPRGSQGFASDSIFIKHDYDKSFAELQDGTRFRISHRFKAFEKLKPSIESCLHSTELERV